MADLGIRALKQNASAVVAQAAAGEVVTITDRGRPMAQLTPLPSSRLQQMLASGHARSPRHSLASLPAPTKGPRLSDELAAMRADERD